MSKFLITLKPTGKFFFGGEMTFQVGTNENDVFNRKYASYIIESSKFPQQTSLLGMLRFLLLRKSEFFDNNKNQIKNPHDPGLSQLIGNSSFIVGKTDGYGKIENISPCFLKRGDDNVFLLPKDCGSEKIGGLKKIVLCDKRFNYNHRLIGIEKILRYPTEEEKKKGCCEKAWITKDGLNNWYWDGKDIIKEDDIFIKDRRIGINRDIKTGKTPDNALFKQVNYRLADGYCFAFYADIGNISEGKSKSFSVYDKEIVSIGADSSQFVINIQPVDKETETSFSIPADYQPTLEGGYGKIILASPSYIPDNALDNACFSITETIPFKFMETTIETKDYSRLGKKISHSNRYELYQTGSVFYFRTQGDMESFIKIIEGQKEFYLIGYNHIYNR